MEVGWGKKKFHLGGANLRVKSARANQSTKFSFSRKAIIRKGYCNLEKFGSRGPRPRFLLLDVREFGVRTAGTERAGPGVTGVLTDEDRPLSKSACNLKLEGPLLTVTWTRKILHSAPNSMDLLLRKEESFEWLGFRKKESEKEGSLPFKISRICS